MIGQIIINVRADGKCEVAYLGGDSPSGYGSYCQPMTPDKAIGAVREQITKILKSPADSVEIERCGH